MRVLVCGSRDWTDVATLRDCLDRLAAVVRVSIVIEGEARGADTMAREWALDHGIAVDRFPADWARLGKSAGIERNLRMLDDGEPDIVVAFPLGKSHGTWHMVRTARKAGVPVLIMPADRAVIDALGEGVFV